MTTTNVDCELGVQCSVQELQFLIRSEPFHFFEGGGGGGWNSLTKHFCSIVKQEKQSYSMGSTLCTAFPQEKISLVSYYSTDQSFKLYLKFLKQFEKYSGTVFDNTSMALGLLLTA